MTYTRQSRSDNIQQPGGITSIDLTNSSPTATAILRDGSYVGVGLVYAVGAIRVTPAIGEQWMLEKNGGVWRLLHRLPANDPNATMERTQGQHILGSGQGPLELTGTQVNIDAPVMRLGDTLYRDNSGILEYSTDNGTTWHPVGAGGGGGGSAQVFDEVPTGTIDGVNATYTTASNFVSSTTAVYLNGLRERLGAGYTESSPHTILFATPPQTGDVVIIDYVLA